jgi:hypothetical protein
LYEYFVKNLINNTDEFIDLSEDQISNKIEEKWDKFINEDLEKIEGYLNDLSK